MLSSVATETEWMDKDFGEKSLVNDRPATRLLSVTTDLDSSSLAIDIAPLYRYLWFGDDSPNPHNYRRQLAMFPLIAVYIASWIRYLVYKR